MYMGESCVLSLHILVKSHEKMEEIKDANHLFTRLAYKEDPVIIIYAGGEHVFV